MKQLLFIIGVAFALQSCDTCAHIPTYGGHAAMVYGHSDYGGNMKPTKNPYYVKAKKSHYHYHNYYK